MFTERPRLRLDISCKVAALGLAATLLAAACGDTRASAAADGDVLRVVATTTVLGDLVEQVGREHVEVTSLVPKGGEVHTFDPTPSDLRAVADTDLVVMNGLGLDDWLRTVVDGSGASAPIVVLAEDLPGVEYQAGEDADEAVNPHLWLDVRNAMRYVERIVAALETADPTNAEAYRADGTAYLDRLEILDAWARERIASIPEDARTVVSFHEAFPYFADAYGLSIVGSIVDAPGQDPSAGEIASLVEAIRSSGAKAVFAEAQFDPGLAETVAEEAGIPVVTDLYNDSLGDAPVDTYEGLIRWDVDRVVDALTG
jgi:ABC-type Zn uptake system ZnuABC Zn-binding protein ZnuA